MHHQSQPSPPPPSPASPTTTPKDHTKITLYVILATSFFSILFILSLPYSTTFSHNPDTGLPDPALFPSRSISSSDPPPPSLAYLISGSSSDSARIIRLLHATYHPKNQYLLHLDLSASQEERDRLAVTVQSVPIFRAAQNVNVIGKSDFAYPRGSSSISSTLHGASILLRLSHDWNWFISLSVGDYPLVTQDDLLHILSYLPKDLNFVNHTSYIGWKEYSHFTLELLLLDDYYGCVFYVVGVLGGRSRRLKPIIVDTGLYLSEKEEVFYATQIRQLPNAFRLFTGSTFTILSRSFMEFSILGTDNLPRTLLMYFSNTPYSLSSYFQTLVCNSHQYRRTVVNNNLLVASNSSATENPSPLGSAGFEAMIQSGAAFASKFKDDDPLLDRIDLEFLNRFPGKVGPGGWCLGERGNSTCSVWGDADILRPGPGARRLEKSIVDSLSDGRYKSQQCVVEE